MNGNSKCGKCSKKHDCSIREKLSEIIKEVIIKAEQEVKNLSPTEIDYMIVTDISVIPVRCHNYLGEDEIREGKLDNGPKYILRSRFAPAAG